MRLSFAAAALALTASSLCPVASATQGSAQFVSTWVEDGLQRYRFTFQGVSADNAGEDFLNAFRAIGGITSNWQCWYDDTNGWTFDDSEIEGCGGLNIIAAGVLDVVGGFIDTIGLAGVYEQQGGCD